MIQRTVSGKVIDKAATRVAELPRWEVRDEWGLPVVVRGEPTDEFPLWKIFRAIDATAAAELAVEWLINRCERDLDDEVTVEVKSLPHGDWQRVVVHVWWSVEFEVSATSIRPAKRRNQA